MCRIAGLDIDLAHLISSLPFLPKSSTARSSHWIFLSKIQKQNCPHEESRMRKYYPPLCVRFTNATMHSRPGSGNTSRTRHSGRYLPARTHADLFALGSPARKNHQSVSVHRICRCPRSEILAVQNGTRQDVSLYTLRLSARRCEPAPPAGTSGKDCQGL